MNMNTKNKTEEVEKICTPAKVCVTVLEKESDKQQHPAGFATTKIQKHHAGFATTKIHPEGFVFLENRGVCVTRKGK